MCVDAQMLNVTALAWWGYHKCGGCANPETQWVDMVRMWERGWSDEKVGMSGRCVRLPYP